MTAAPIEAFLSALTECRLLDPTQAADIRRWAAAVTPDPTGLARELIGRGWLTGYQVREAAKGRGKELTVGPYLLLDLLGEGGMGRVFRARHTRLGRDVALKVIKREKLSNPQAVSRFQQEIHAAAQLSHPNVVLAFDAESAGGHLFLSMEYVEGTDLTRLVLKHGPMPVPHACDAIRQAALGLQHAFERGLVHRDVKPSNLLYTPKGQVKVLDLGLAQLAEPSVRGGENAGRVTQDGFVLGTPDFLAPEQAQNPSGVDIRADVYALGATLFFLLTARVPYDVPTPTEKLIKHISAPPPSVREHRPDVPPQLDALVRWLMAKRPEDRPQTPAQVAMALAPFGLPHPGGPAAAPPGGPPAYQPPGPTVPDSAVPDSAVPPPAVNPFGDLAGGPSIVRQTRAVRAKAKPPSSLPLVIAGAAVAVMLAGAGVVAAFYFLSQTTPTVADPGPLPDEFANAAGQPMVRLPAGSFTMGSPDTEPGRESDEGPQHRVALTREFYLSATEVSRKQYAAVMGTTPGPLPPGLSPKLEDRFPAVGVSWDDAAEFCRKLNQKDPDRRPGWEYRLPTEAEWEYAARAGADGPFPAGRRVVQYRHGVFALADDDKYGEPNPEVQQDRYQFADRPAPVNPRGGDIDYSFRREPNRWKLFDLNGNVWEWCADRYGDYPADDQTDPTGPEAGVWRVLRGGAHNTPADRCRAAARRGADPTTRDPAVGFRVAFAPKR